MFSVRLLTDLTCCLMFLVFGSANVNSEQCTDSVDVFIFVVVVVVVVGVVVDIVVSQRSWMKTIDCVNDCKWEKSLLFKFESHANKSANKQLARAGLVRTSSNHTTTYLFTYLLAVCFKVVKVIFCYRRQKSKAK